MLNASLVQVEKTNLQLENLLYEKNHYLKEIQACRSFKSAFTDEQIYSAEPMTLPSGAADAHQLELSRLTAELNGEHLKSPSLTTIPHSVERPSLDADGSRCAARSAERQELERQRNEQLAKKTKLQAEIATNHKRLRAFDGELKARRRHLSGRAPLTTLAALWPLTRRGAAQKMVEATQSLRSMVAIPANPAQKDEEQAALLQVLPPPLAALATLLLECKVRRPCPDAALGSPWEAPRLPRAPLPHARLVVPLLCAACGPDGLDGPCPESAAPLCCGCRPRRRCRTRS